MLHCQEVNARATLSGGEWQAFKAAKEFTTHSLLEPGPRIIPDVLTLGQGHLLLVCPDCLQLLHLLLRLP